MSALYVDFVDARPSGVLELYYSKQLVCDLEQAYRPIGAVGEHHGGNQVPVG